MLIRLSDAAGASKKVPVEKVLGDNGLLADRAKFEKYESVHMVNVRKKYAGFPRSGRYCIPFDKKETVKRDLVGTFDLAGFCHTFPTFYQLCKASGSDKVGWGQNNPDQLDGNHYGHHNYEAFYPMLLEQMRFKPVR